MPCRSLVLSILSLLLAVPSLAAPTRLAQQGRVVDSAGGPLEGAHTLGFVLFDAATGGSSLWSEERSVDFEGGYYSLTLGEQVPLDDAIFDIESAWLEVTIDGETLSPRQEIVSVPYALRATAAAHLEGGLVDAAEIAVDGTVVIDAAGNWVGPTPAVGWNDLSGVPADIADGDQDTNTQLSNAEVAAAALAEGFVPGPHTTNTDTLLDLALTCFQGEIPSWDAGNGLWICVPDLDTQLSETEVDGMVANNGYLVPDSAGNVGIGTSTPTEKLTVVGTVESTMGGFRFPDGTLQDTAAIDPAGTIIYTRCAWTSTYSSGIGSCSPPGCPSGWADLGVTGNVKAAVTHGDQTHAAYQESGGYQERACHVALPVTILTTRCAWTSTYSSGIGACTPPVCPTGWSDLGVTGNVKASVTHSNQTHAAYQESGGYQERICSF